MNARSLNKRIEFWQSAATTDGYGGSTVTDTQITTSWAMLKTQGSEKVSELGLDYTKETVLVTVRKRNDIDLNSKTLYVKYRDNRYSIASFPSNKDFNDAYITFLMVKQKPDSRTAQTVIP